MSVGDEQSAAAKRSRTATDQKSGARMEQGSSDHNPSTNPPPGLDAAKHTASQRAAHRAAALRQGVFPAMMASALGMEKLDFDASALKVYLEQLLEDSGNPRDP